jgi:nitrate/nitrite-specific signal transduction histidine kinase
MRFGLPRWMNWDWSARCVSWRPNTSDQTCAWILMPQMPSRPCWRPQRWQSIASVQEALTNVVRHAQASGCAVSLAVRDGLEVSIRDNGQGMPAQQPVGVGLLSMRERATELGGECAITSACGEGTMVRAWLPLTHTPPPLSATSVTKADER